MRAGIKGILCFVVSCLLTSGATRADSVIVQAATSNVAGSATDLFQGAAITHISPLYPSFSGNDMFGATSLGSLEPGNTVYSDNFPGVNTTFNVVFDVGTSVGLRKFRVLLADDSGAGFDARGVNSFTLNGIDGVDGNGIPTSGSQLASVTVNADDDDFSNYSEKYGSSVIEIVGTFSSPQTYQFFQAVFPSAYGNSGPRVLEIDGFAVVPFPPAVLGGLAMLGGAGLFRGIRYHRSILRNL